MVQCPAAAGGAFAAAGAAIPKQPRQAKASANPILPNARAALVFPHPAEWFMEESRKVLMDWLRGEFAAEQGSGFARLRQVPDTNVIRFVDKFTALPPEEQAGVVDILMEWSSHQFFPGPIPAPVVERFTQITKRPGFAEGVRYTGANLLAGLAKAHQAKGGLSGWLQSQGITGLAARPPEQLADGIEDLKPIGIPRLRGMVERAFRDRFAAVPRDMGSEMWRYSGKFGDAGVVAEIRYSGRAGRPQLSYSATIQHPALTKPLAGMTFESMLGAGFGWWDYLTVKNAERSVELLCGLVEYLAKLPERLPRAGSGL